MPNPMDAILARIERGNQQRRENALNEIFARSYEPGQRTETPMYGPTPSGAALPPVVQQEPGQINVRNALARMAQSGEPGMAIKAFQLQQQLDAFELEKQKALRAGAGSAGPMSVQETMWFMDPRRTPQEKAAHLALKRAQQVMNLGGTQAVLDPTTGQISQSFAVTPKPEQMPAFQGEQEAAKTSGEARGKATIALPGKELEFESMVDQVNKLKAHPGKPYATGRMSLIPDILTTGTEAKNFKVQLEQLKGGAFLQARQELKGGGAITDFEGKKAEQATARLDTAQTTEEFDKALDDYVYWVDRGMKKLRASTGKEYAGVTDVNNQPTQKPTQKAGQIKVIGGKTYININGQWMQQ